MLWKTAYDPTKNMCSPLKRQKNVLKGRKHILVQLIFVIKYNS
jgi:hypothetical protein